MQQAEKLLAILGRMATKPQVKFNKLFQKLYNPNLWLLAYQTIAPKPGNLTAGVDGKTIDGVGLKLIEELIADLKASRYKPKPVRRTYIPKSNGKFRPLGILTFKDKLVQTVLKLMLQAIYEPTFTDTSHGFRPNHSTHTALQQIKRMEGVSFWVEGDIKGFFDHLNPKTLVQILSKRITDKRFVHLIEQFLKAGYLEDHTYHPTYAGVAQGGNLSPLLSNIYLSQLDYAVAQKTQAFNTGKKRARTNEYHSLSNKVAYAKKKARLNGDWNSYKVLKAQLLHTQATNPFDPNFRRLYYTRFADDFILGIVGSKKEAENLKNWLHQYLKEELQLELSEQKTLITHATKRVRFLGYDIQRWKGQRVFRYRTRRGAVTRRTLSYKLQLLMPYDKTVAFAKKYGQVNGWRGRHRAELLNLSELEIMMIYNTELRGFLNYYALADNLKLDANKLLWLSTTSFLRTIAAKRQSSLVKVAKSFKRGPAQYVVALKGENGQVVREYELLASTRQLKRELVTYGKPEQIPTTVYYRSRTELGQRLLANQCEWCGTVEGRMEVHHIRKLGNLKGKNFWEAQMIQRRRKTMVLCEECHDELHSGKLVEQKKATRGELESRIPLTR